MKQIEEMEINENYEQQLKEKEKIENEIDWENTTRISLIAGYYVGAIIVGLCFLL